MVNETDDIVVGYSWTCVDDLCMLSARWFENQLLTDIFNPTLLAQNHDKETSHWTASSKHYPRPFKVQGPTSRSTRRLDKPKLGGTNYQFLKLM